MGDDNVKPEFSSILEFEDLGDEPQVFELIANEEERSALSNRFDLVGIEALSAKITVFWLKKNKVLAVTGQLIAAVTQKCVVTLDPVSADITEDVDIILARDIPAAADIVDPEDAEPLEGESIDIGELVAEELSLSLNPYPRRADIDPKDLKLGPGATLSDEDEAEAAVRKNNPFQVLEGLKPKL